MWLSRINAFLLEFYWKRTNSEPEVWLSRINAANLNEFDPQIDVTYEFVKHRWSFTSARRHASTCSITRHEATRKWIEFHGKAWSLTEIYHLGGGIRLEPAGIVFNRILTEQYWFWTLIPPYLWLRMYWICIEFLKKSIDSGHSYLRLRILFIFNIIFDSRSSGSEFVCFQ